MLTNADSTFFKDSINPFQVKILFLYTLKMSENLCSGNIEMEHWLETG